MLLRRVVENIRSRNWTAVVLDFGIVVLGVVIGIQVSNWNEARAERRNERLIPGRLESDFVLIRSQENEYIIKVRDALSDAEKLREAAATLCQETCPV